MVIRAMHVVAHEDDDLLFMNPDVSAAIRAGTPVVTVYMTAGNISGEGDTDGERTRSRQLGIKAAYTTMAGVPMNSPWSGDALTVAGKQVEHYVLDANPAVELVFVNLPDAGMEFLYAGTPKDTVVADDGVVTTSFTYTHADVVAVLVALLNRFQPTVVRAQDPVPDVRWPPFGEHPDHIAVASFVNEAQAAHGGRPVTVNYRCYNIAGAAANLDDPTHADKAHTFAAYTPFDPYAADLDWTGKMLYRWSGGTNWIGSNEDGRLQIFVVRGGTCFRYWQNTDGTWAGPAVLGGAGGPLAPALAVGNNADGRLEIFGRRLSDHHIVTTYQTVVNGAWTTAWTDFGSPNLGAADADQIGVPVVANNGDGRMEIFVKNAGGGVSTRYQTRINGGWSDWVDMFGTEVLDGLAAVTNPAGCIEVFAATHTKVLHWYQDRPNVGFTRNEDFPAPRPASGPTAVLSQDGTILVAYHIPDTGQIGVSRQVEPAGGWGDPVVLDGHVGLGEAAMVTGPPGPDARITMFARTYGGGFEATTQVAADGDFGPWSAHDGEPIIGFPAAGLDRSGRVVLVGLGLDGVVRVRTQTASNAAAPFTPWQPLAA